MSIITEEVIEGFQKRLDTHPVYAAVETVEDLRIFMRHHVYSVWDFMSLIKYLQSVVAPASYPWLSKGDASVRRFINELVLEEECDQTMDGSGFTSHFDLYQGAMEEIGADTGVVRRFVDRVHQDGIEAALMMDDVPAPSRGFTTRTFRFIDSGHPHEVAAALALGREHIIPGMFRSILSRIGVTAEDAPTFHYYLNRHVHLDEDFHAPLSLRLLESLCGEDTQKKEQALRAAEEAIDARLTLWDGVHAAITSDVRIA